jgi:uncharacterized RDD family membrane protein YckC
MSIVDVNSIIALNLQAAVLRALWLLLTFFVFFFYTDIPLRVEITRAHLASHACFICITLIYSLLMQMHVSSSFYHMG